MTDHPHYRVRAPARLHLGFLDPDASCGRRFGSIGLALEGIATEVSAQPHDRLEFAGQTDDRVEQLSRRLLLHYGLPEAVRITVESQIPVHAGLGSGTQLALALGSIILRLFGRVVAVDEIGAVMQRGKRSGIGLKLFQHGGLIIDAGRGPDTVTPPMVARYPFPDSWRVVLLFDSQRSGLNGSDELAAFKRLPALPRAEAARLCHLTLMGLMPAVLEQDFVAFSAALGEIQAVVAEYFSPAQNGAYTSPIVAQAMADCAGDPQLRGLGQSSWGPTGFIFVPHQAAAEALVERLGQRPGLDYQICSARNQGAESSEPG